MAYLLHQLVREAANDDPTREAVRCSGRSLTYGDVEIASNRLARVLIDGGVRRGDRVAIRLPKCVEMLVAVYGVLKAGAAYVPLDPQAPVSRVATVADDCAIAALVSTRKSAEGLLGAMESERPRLAVVVEMAVPSKVQLEDSEDLSCASVTYAAATSAGETDLPTVPIIDQDLAYILYTSGSTGSPKGVMLTHRNALTFVEWCAATIGIGPHDRLSNHAPLHFDLSVFDLFLAARGKASVVLVPEEEAFFGSELARFIEGERITVWYSVPSALMLLTEALDESRDLPTLRAVVFAGEVFPTKHLRELQRLVPRAALWNLYGPTETNVCSYYNVHDLPDDDHPIPIGRACENTEVFAIKDDGTVASEGEEGELYVRGSTVMKGYWGRPDATRAALVPDPRAAHLGDPAYRTGDLVRLRADGDYDFLGRRDHQIKSRGFRIELGEVESVLSAHPAVSEAVTVAIPHEAWGTAIIAFVVPREGASLTERHARAHVATRLPRYMVPSSVRFVDELPRTSTGKVDRTGLRASVGDSSDVAR